MLLLCFYERYCISLELLKSKILTINTASDIEVEFYL